MKIFYIGRFPPPYGGVTIKNKLLYEKMTEFISVDKINLDLIKNFNLKEIYRFLKIVLNRDARFIIGSAGKYRKIISMILYYINRKALNKSILIVMGGVTAKIIADDHKYFLWVKEYRQIYVETVSMKKELTNLGLNNVTVFPNCREKPDREIKIKNNNTDFLKLVFFSNISKEKGTDIIFDALDKLKSLNINCLVDFYGHIEKSYQNEFYEEIKKRNNTEYCGVFQQTKNELYEMMSEYDFLLLPTKSKTEGVPGVLVEAKIAGVPSIVSNLSYNADIIENGIDGYVLNNNNSEELSKTIHKIAMDRKEIVFFKKSAIISSEYYMIEGYIEAMLKELTRT